MSCSCNFPKHFLDQTLDLTTPQVAVDMASAILSMPAIEFCDENLDTIVIQSKFQASDNLLEGTYILMMDKETERNIMKMIGRYYE